MEFITLITGPGNHANILVNDFVKKKSNFQYTEYWPKFKILRFKKGKLIEEKHFWWYDSFSKLLWYLAVKLKLSNGYKRHLDILYPLYDFIISFYLGPSNLLISWPQVSLFSSRKIKKREGKVYLEYPMIHIDDHQNIMKEEYLKWDVPFSIQNNIFSPFMMRRVRKEIEIADSVTVLSTYALQSFVMNNVDEKKIQIRKFPLLRINNTIPTNTNKLIVLFVGRVNLMKGVQYLLKDFYNWCCDRDDIELNLVGPVSKEIFKVLKKYSCSNIKILGQKTKTELDQIYKKSNILVLPSVQESFGMVILEALSYNLEIIASLNCGAPDLQKLYPKKITLVNNIDQGALGAELMSRLI